MLIKDENDKKEGNRRRKLKYSVRELMRRKYTPLQFEGAWFEAVGLPDSCGSWCIWGNSGNGKTSFTVQLAKYLMRFGKVYYNSLEEGIKLSYTTALKRYNIDEKDGTMVTLNKVTLEELIELLEKRRSPKFVIIDSLQASGINMKDYQNLLKQFKDKLFIFISHANGSLPSDAVGKEIMYDADVKIYVKNFVAHCKSRLKAGGVGEFKI